MKRLIALAGVALLAFFLGGSSPAKASVDCTVHQSWAGSESATQRDGWTLVQVPVNQSIQIDHLTLSASYASHTPVYAEELLLAGISPSPLQQNGDGTPVVSPSSAFGPLGVSTSGQGHNENKTLSDNVLASRIFKATAGSASVLVDENYAVPFQVPAGDVVWVYYATVGGAALDPEVQVQMAWQTAGCS